MFLIIYFVMLSLKLESQMETVLKKTNTLGILCLEASRTNKRLNTETNGSLTITNHMNRFYTMQKN